MSMIIMVSACLTGICTRYDGQCKLYRKALNAMKGHSIIPFCPEQMGSLPTPRPKATLSAIAEDIINGNGNVVNELGEYVTDNFLAGARASLMLANTVKPDLIILRENSPSCGYIKTNIEWQRKGGMGIAAHLLYSKGFEIISF